MKLFKKINLGLKSIFNKENTFIRLHTDNQDVIEKRGVSLNVLPSGELTNAEDIKFPPMKGDCTITRVDIIDIKGNVLFHGKIEKHIKLNETPRFIAGSIITEEFGG